MTTHRSLVRMFAVLLCAALITAATPTTASARENNGRECLPGLGEAALQRPIYLRLYAVLLFHQTQLRNRLDQVQDQASYQLLLNRARTIASSIDDGRVVVTLPDGTVVLDTARTDDPANALPVGNSYQHFVEKTVNENHNSRVAIFSAQLFPCGVGVESKVSTTTNSSEVYVALRLGRHLNSSGTARLSTIR